MDCKKTEVPIRLRTFDMSKIGSNKILVFIGKRNTGKSFLVLDYLYHNRDIPIATCIAPTNSMNKTYTPHIPGILIHDKYSSDLIENFVMRQKRITKKVRSDPVYKDVDPRAVLILDDCLYNAKEWSRDENINWIFFNGRHATITCIITLQFVLGLNPMLRNNIDYVFLCREPRLNVQKKIYEQFAGIFPTFDMFRQVFNQCTENYGCMVIEISSISEKIEDQVFYYRAIKHDAFRLCPDNLWVHNDMSDDDSDMEPKQSYAIGNNASKFKYNVSIDQ